MASKLQIASIFGIDRSTLYSWIARGCPIVRPSYRRGQPSQLDPEAVLKWRLEDLRRLGYEPDMLTKERRRIRERLKGMQTGRLF